MSEPLRKPRSEFSIDEITLESQRRASNPAASAWVAANAGSGKTFVLGSRVKRLLLSGVAPEKILCLTYTKAAAANMANRILSDLAAWVLLPEKDLRAALALLDGRAPQQITGRELRRARQLFALALETPGGLKIQTIHAFCDALLHRFPFEAGIAGQFQVLDDLQREAMIADAFERALRSEDKTLQAALVGLLLLCAPETLRKTITKNYSRFSNLFQETENLKPGIYAALDIDERQDAQTLESGILEGALLPESQWVHAIELLKSTGKNWDKCRADDLAQALRQQGKAKALAYLNIFLNSDEQIRARKNFLTADFKNLAPDLANALLTELDRLVPLYQQLRLHKIAQATLAFLRLSETIWRDVETAKAMSGLLDFADIIARADTLLNSEAAVWVRYKLDQGVDHILVDEAQDTSAQQWRVISGLIQEFFAGRGAREALRTVFVVGDDKQSIFSFQGARRELFDAERRRISSLSKGAELSFEAVSLHLSFRSSPVILQAVDGIFADAIVARDVTSEENFPPHEAAKRSLPGLVEVWPVEMPSVKSDITAFEHPFITPGSDNPRLRLAARIAAEVARAVTAKKIEAGEVLILVRTRNSLFEALLRELKKSGLPVAGADRLVLNDHIAVMDLIALTEAVLLPEDNLNFAALLKSPLFSFGEDDIFALAHNRAASLFDALKNRAQEKPLWQQGLDRFLAWRQRAKNCRPYEFYAQVLGTDNMRKAICARLGAEANEVLDEFLNAALIFENAATPSLQNFLKFMRETRAEIKREMQQGQNEVRVMTVHNAKGLEAKWIILADTLDKPGKAQLDDFYEFDTKAGRALIWAPGEKNRIGVIGDAKDAVQRAQEGEYRRLLYVALTRAEERLTICGASTKEKISEDCWYSFAARALAPLSQEEHDEHGELRHIMKAGELPQAALPVENDNEETIAPPAWLDTKPKSPIPALVFKPSAAGIYEPSAGFSETAPDLARSRGVLLHRLLEHLPRYPEDARAIAAKNFLDKQAVHFSEDERQELIAEALNVLALPQAKGFFGEDALPEIVLNADIELKNGRRAIVQGQADRLVLTPDTLHIIDYKSGLAPKPSDLPPPYMAQLSLYREALKTLAGKRAIRCYLLWTSVPRLDEIGHAALDQALAKLA
jgi:ATP-dependent helicase/nuclease subunit A